MENENTTAEAVNVGTIIENKEVASDVLNAPMQEKVNDFQERAEKAINEITPILEKYNVGYSVERSEKIVLVDMKK